MDWCSWSSPLTDSLFRSITSRNIKTEEIGLSYMITKLITTRHIVWHDPTCFILPQLDDLGNGLNILVFICNFKQPEIHFLRLWLFWQLCRSGISVSVGKRLKLNSCIHHVGCKHFAKKYTSRAGNRTPAAAVRGRNPNH